MTFDSQPLTADNAPETPQRDVQHEQHEPITGWGARTPILSRADAIAGVLLVIILCVGAYFRFTGQNWDDYTHLHPDERFLTGVIDKLAGPLEPTGSDANQAQQLQLCLQRYPQTQGAATSIFDSQCSTWYPKNAGNGSYVYGELPLFVVKFATQLTASASGDNEWLHYNGAHLVGRSVSAIADLISVIFLFLIGRRLYNAWIGVLAAALYAAAVFPIQLSHYWTTDAFTNLPVVIAFWFATRAMDRCKWYDFVGFGVGMGAALATRINTAFLFGIIVLAAMIYALPAFDMSLPGRERWRLIYRALSNCVLAAIATFITFRITNPHAFTGGPGLYGFLAPFTWLTPLIAAWFILGVILNPSLARARRMQWFLLALAIGIIVPASIAFVGFLELRSETPGTPVNFLSAATPYAPWIEELQRSQAFLNGQVDFPPNHQWASRPSYLFPWRNIVLWGLGIPLGLMAWFGWAWAGLQILRARSQWTRHILPFTWILVYFGYMGRQWVMTMRYYINLYPFLILMAAWALYEIFTRARRYVQQNPTTRRRLAYVGGTLLLIGVIGLTYVWAAMFVRIYQRQLTRVEATRWVQRNLPSGLSTTITAPDGTTRLVNMFAASQIELNVTQYQPYQRQVTEVIRGNGLVADRVVVNHIADPEHSDQKKRFTVGIATDSAGTQIIAQGTLTDDFSVSGGRLGATYTVMLDQAALLGPGQPYFLVSWSDSPLDVLRDGNSQSDFLLTNGQGERVGLIRLPEKDKEAISGFGPTPVRTQFRAPIAGTIDRIDIRHLLDPTRSGNQVNVHVRLLKPGGNTALAEGTLTTEAGSTRTSPFGEAYSVKLDEPIKVEAEQALDLEIASDTPVQVTGTVIAWEGDWDDPVPWAVCPIPDDMPLTHDTPSGLSSGHCEAFGGLGTWYKEAKLQMALEDDTLKRSTMQAALDQADYFVITSNRFYDSLSRMPLRFPMSIRFYDTLFSQQLGFDLVKTVTSFPSLGSFEIADQNLPTYGSPKWVNEWESEEAFSVYDHPTVFLFKKNDKYTPSLLAGVLGSVTTTEASAVTFKPEDTTLIGRVAWNPTQSSPAPTGFMMSDTLRAIQTNGGTFKDLFNRDWPINTSPLLAVVVWWALMLIIGFAAWPILFILLPALPDRGYPLVKIAGLLIVAWIVWAGGTLNLLTWSQPGIAITLAGLALVGLIVGWRNRAELMDYMRINWRHMLIIELITLVLFVGFLFVRLGNPDLWAQVLGGEKPMDFAFFTAVLRSTVFPPYDPWYAGGYLNYYYFGFVLVGMPVKLLGLMPSIAYNLIVPTLFAMTGIAAFSFAFNLVAYRWFHPRDEGDENGETAQARRRFALRIPRASPYLAGTLALLLCVVLGNLDTPRVFWMGVAKAGGYSFDPNDMLTWKLSEFVRQNGRQPSPEESLQLTQAVDNPSFGDQISYGLHNAQHFISSLGAGIGQVFNGGLLPISPDRWFWAPRSVVGELPGSNNEINEMPYFTFVFADLHAHMIALPLTLLVLGWLLAEVLAAGRIARSTLTVIAATAFGGLAVGVLQPTNTWDWPTYLLLAILAITFAMYLRRKRFGRRSVLPWMAQLAWFFAVQAVAAMPFTAFWATSYLSENAIKSFEGNKTPIWAYLDIHGLFLFAVVTLLLWQTARLLRKLYVRDFIGRAWALILLAAFIGVTVLFTLFFISVPVKIWLFSLPIPISLICLPLLAWCAILFCVPDQSREMRVLYLLTGLALAVSFGPEVAVLGADIGRQNTFFKFYMQAWILFSLVGGVALAWMIQASVRWGMVLRGAWLGFLVLLLTAAGLFPIMSTQGKIAMRMAPQAPHTLDGDAYMEYATYYEAATPIPLADDLKVIRWLQDNVKGSPVILEGYMSEYKLGGRISISTGLPTVIGWNFHERQQRTIDPLPNLVFQRAANVNAMYNTTDINTFWTMLKFYNIQYIVVNKMEQTIYSAQGLAKFDEMVRRGLLEVVYKQDYQDTGLDENGMKTSKTVFSRIYHVVPGATLQDVLAGG